MSSVIFSDYIHFTTDEVTKVAGYPTCSNLKNCRKELAALFSTVDCTIPEAKTHGHAFLTYTDLQWLAKVNIAALVAAPTLPGDLI